MPPSKISIVAVATAPGVPNEINPRTPTTALSLHMQTAALTSRHLARGHLLRQDQSCVFIITPSVLFAFHISTFLLRFRFFGQRSARLSHLSCAALPLYLMRCLAYFLPSTALCVQ
jgi:hypothetical protein